MRDRFNEQLEQLNVELIKMGALCEEAISAAAKALLEGDAALRETAAAAERDSIDSFVRKNLGLAQEVIRKDDEIDRMFLEVKDELIRRIGQGDSGETCMDLLMIAKYFERIGDHACNIAEWVEYSLTGQHGDM